MRPSVRHWAAADSWRCEVALYRGTKSLVILMQCAVTRWLPRAEIEFFFPSDRKRAKHFLEYGYNSPTVWRRFTERIVYGTWLQAINHATSQQLFFGMANSFSVFLSNRSRQLWVRSTVTRIPRPRTVGIIFITLWRKKVPKIFSLERYL
jgi:hypothetical protein